MSAIDIRTSDTETNASPFPRSNVGKDTPRSRWEAKGVAAEKAGGFIPTRPFIARRIERTVDVTKTGILQWSLLSDNHDARHVVIADDSDLLAHIIANDPQVANFKNRDSDDILPRVRCEVERGAIGPYHVTAWKELEPTDAEIKRMATRPIFDRLHEMAKALGVSLGECDEIIRRYQGLVQWEPYAVQALHVRGVERNANERDYWADKARDANVYEEFHAMSEQPVSALVEWFGQKPVERLKWGAELENMSDDRARYSITTHFERELTKLDRFVLGVAVDVLGMSVLDSIEKIGRSKTIDLLQTYLDNEDKTVTTPATIQAPAKNDWWNDANKLALLLDRAFTSKSNPGIPRDEMAGALCAVYGVDTLTEIDAKGKDAVETLIRRWRADSSGEPIQEYEDAIAEPPQGASNEPPATDTHAMTKDGQARQLAAVETGKPKNYPNYPESPVVVYPMERGGIVYKGVRFSVTLRLGGDFKMARLLMDEFIMNKDLIDPSCLVRPMQNAATGGSAAPAPLPPASTAPAAPSAPAANNDGGTIVIREIKKVADEGKTTYHLFDTVGAEKSALRTQMTDVFANVVAVDLMDVGKRYQVNWTVAWKPSKNMGPSGHPYKNVAKITVNDALLA